MNSPGSNRRRTGILLTLALALFGLVLAAAWHQGGPNDRLLVIPLGLGGLALARATWRAGPGDPHRS